MKGDYSVVFSPLPPASRATIPPTVWAVPSVVPGHRVHSAQTWECASRDFLTPPLDGGRAHEAAPASACPPSPQSSRQMSDSACLWGLIVRRVSGIRSCPNLTRHQSCMRASDACMLSPQSGLRVLGASTDERFVLIHDVQT